jgi:hypothetical protein
VLGRFTVPFDEGFPAERRKVAPSWARAIYFFILIVKAPPYLEELRITYPAKQSHIPEDQTPKKHC